ERARRVLVLAFLRVLAMLVGEGRGARQRQRNEDRFHAEVLARRVRSCTGRFSPSTRGSRAHSAWFWSLPRSCSSLCTACRPTRRESLSPGSWGRSCSDR